MTPTPHHQTKEFQTLLDRWNHHQDLRRSGVPVAVLATSRFELEAARSEQRAAA